MSKDKHETKKEAEQPASEQPAGLQHPTLQSPGAKTPELNADQRHLKITIDGKEHEVPSHVSGAKLYELAGNPHQVNNEHGVIVVNNHDPLQLRHGQAFVSRARGTIGEQVVLPQEKVDPSSQMDYGDKPVVAPLQQPSTQSPGGLVQQPVVAPVTGPPSGKPMTSHGPGSQGTGSGGHTPTPMPPSRGGKK